MIVCVCHRVSDRDIAREAAFGCPDFDALQEATRLGTACGACLDCARAEWRGACTSRVVQAERLPQRRVQPA